MLLVAVLTAVLLQGHGPRPQPPQPVAPTTSPVAFSKLRPVGGTPIPVAAGDANAQTSIVDGRVFAGWRTGDGRLQVTAADLATGARLWPTTTLPGTFGDWNGLIGLPSATVLIGERDNGASPDKELFVVDPATGRLRWHIGMDVNGFDILAYRDVLVLADHDKNRTTAYAWTDGRVLWSFDGAITTVFGMHGPGDLDTSSAFYRPSVFGELLSGDTLFRLDPAGGITEYAVATGRPTGRTWSGIHIGDYLLTLAYDGVLYVVDHASLLAVRLDGGPALPAFTSETGNWLAEPVPCGTGRICVIDGPRLAGAEKRTEVVAIEHGRAVWRTPVPDATTLAPAGDHVLVETSGKDGQRTALLDAHGRPVLTDSDGLRYAMRVPGGLVLFAVDSVDPAGGPVAHGRLTGIDLATSRRTDLGTATLALIGASASRGYLVDTAGGLHIYRFLR
ncbi:outer membrane protein assembly factor BamB family protein [Hamadaea tsunoensis]|uniref:outer membrane protein assembly factor BamB family protein n=1 Tax=Hamadaea tsunoensis TaxID=53368 RepID=UPI002ADD84EB|nr:PQQ-binding-like beta-propeller repeat protein [Hamadaea tsunoensis]